MKMLVRYLLTVISGLVLTCALNAQVVSSMDSELSRYEALCQECLELKSRIAAGEIVPRRQAESLIEDFVSMNARLKEDIHEMTAAQRKRFNAVGVWFSTGRKPQVQSAPSLEALPAPPYPHIMTTTPKTDEICHVDHSHDIPGRQDYLRKFILADVSFPDMSYGLMAGLQGRRCGGYLRFRSDFTKTPETLYECLSDGSLPHGGKMWTSGDIRNSNLYITGGALVQIVDWLSVYVGAGYGRRTLAWQDIDGNWARVSDWSRKGLTIDAGLLLSWRNLAFSAGLSTMTFKTCVFSLGIGVRL
jgi:hypothetical protein